MSLPRLTARVLATTIALAGSVLAQDAARGDAARGDAARGDAARGDAARGEKLFQQRCAACHGIAAGQNKLGPHLAGIVGRAAGSVAGAKYSPALAASGIIWDEAALDAYIAAPKQAVPGTTMAVAVANAAQRADLVAYLKTLTP
jgi:cytochrome c